MRYFQLSGFYIPTPKRYKKKYICRCVFGTKDVYLKKLKASSISFRPHIVK